jgi:1-acyl-sn-glycerol-3-phosphate acyltransferase
MSIQAGPLSAGPSQAPAVASDNATELVAIVEAVAQELHPERIVRATLDSSFDRDLGLDSLGRVELWLRSERAFGVSLPEQTLAGCETPRDLWRALRAAAPAGSLAATFAGPRAASAPVLPEAAPATASTLNEVVAWHADKHAQRLHIVVAGGEDETEITYGQLYERAAALASGLQESGIQRGETVAIMLPTSPEYFAAFFGVLLAGAVPVPIYPPMRSSQLVAHLERQVAILANAQAVLLIAPAEAAPLAQRVRPLVPTLRRIATPAELAGDPARLQPAAPHPDDVALIQYTSGSTGNPKGVVLTHANLLANIRAMGRAAEVTSADVFVSWLPLYHDMGLICAWLSSLYFAFRFVVMSPLSFVGHPARWLWAIHRHGGSLSGGPNFGYELCLRHIDDAELAGLDLSSWRLAFNGAEPVSADTLQRFVERFAAYGLRREALTPVFGLAECCVGLAVTAGRGPLIDHIDRSVLGKRGLAVPVPAEAPVAQHVVGCGRALPGHAMRIVDASGRELPDRQEGRLQFRGPSATSGYFRNPEATRRLFDGDWLDSGDLAYLVDGEVFPTGRAKDLIIRAGRNLYPQEIEEVVGRLPGIRAGGVAVFGVPDPASGSERLVVLAESRSGDAATLTELRATVQDAVVDVLGEPADEVVVSPTRRVLKTSSGKIRRAETRQLYLRGGALPPLWRQKARWFRRELAARLRLGVQRARAWLWGVHARAMFWLIAPITWAVVASLTRPQASWAFSRRAAQLLCLLTGTRLLVEGREHLAGGGPRVLVANHTSYLDGIALVAALPWRNYRFIAKRELRDDHVANKFLEHLGADFVDRVDPVVGAEDAARQVGAARIGCSPIFFPEGTFSGLPGLHAFRMGAFVTAAQAGLPVVPITLRGARIILPDKAWLPRRGVLRVVIGAPLIPSGDDWAAALVLRDAARREILQRCGEPDVA